MFQLLRSRQMLKTLSISSVPRLLNEHHLHGNRCFLLSGFFTPFQFFGGSCVTDKRNTRGGTIHLPPDSIRITIPGWRFNLYHDYWLYCDLRFNITIIVMFHFNHLNPIMVPQGSIRVSFMFYVIVGKAFAENSRSTSLQRAATRCKLCQAAIFCKGFSHSNINHKRH